MNFYPEIPSPKKEFMINNKLKIVKKVSPKDDKEFKKLPYLNFLSTNLLFIVSIAIHANIGALKKLPVIAPKTKSLTPTPPDFAIKRDTIAAKI